jgi:UDP-N-acetylglucosamine--N-acetylmuramyl-(pentapeptide) pyrophosphoryl-undecaprenol N-acetylglucosamine transferase
MTTLLVSSVGGHLTQLHRLLPVLEGVEPERRWVTFDSPQSRSLLADEDVIYLDYTGPRDVKNILRHTGTARRLFRGRHPYSTIVSTGSGIALSFLPLGRLRGASCHYIESFTRSTGPSATGRVLSHVPGIALYAQYPGWATPPWRYARSVFDVFRPSAAPESTGTIERVVVTLGTMEDYPFRRLVERALAVLPPGVEVLWQTGCTDVSDLPIDGRVQLPAHELQEAVANADAVIAHAGCGSALAALEAGKMPVLIPRLATHGENVDDHQMHLVQELGRRQLAVVRSVEELTLEDLELAALSRVETSRNGAPFELRS